MATTRLYINPTIEKQIRAYCEINNIEDINAFANRCALQGLSIIKYGTSPINNIERENKGVKDIEDKKKVPKKEESAPIEMANKDKEEETKEVKPIKKIRIIKRQ